VPKPSRYVLIWLHEREHYELHLHGQLHQCFQRGDDEAFSRWLKEHTAFAFVGKCGRISVLKEARSGGTGYWYAYRTQDRHTRKRYLGPSARVTFACLEQEAKALSRSPSARREATGREGRRPAASLQAEQRRALLSLKLSPPRLPGSLVERSRLLDELDAAFSHPLTLVSASAGSGKTTLLSAWVALSLRLQTSRGTKRRAERRGAEPACAWLSLDSLDNDPIRFWLWVIAAVRTCLPTFGEAARELLHSPQAPPLSTILVTLLDEMEQVGRDIILLLDDYHVIEDQAIHEAMLFLLDHLPANVHLVLSTRTDPELPLSRFRVRGQMIEIRSSDLHFTREEATSFLVQSVGLPLSEEDAATLHQRTEGWIAGLQLAALSLRKRQDLSGFVKEFAGSHRYLLDYVQQDILTRLPVPLQDFLLQTSIVTSMNAAVCQAVTARPTREECQQMLEEVERANLFVMPLDEQRQWYRFHDLFREALRARLQASQPELLPLLHIRAASFYEAAGELREASAHALAAPDYSLAASLMEQAAPQFWLSGEARTVHTWVFSLPDAILRAHLRLALGAALRFVNSVNLGNETLYVGMQIQMEQTFTRMDEILRRKRELSLSDAEVALIQRRLRLLRALIEARAVVKRGDSERLRHLAQETEALPADSEVSWNMIPLSFTFWLHVMFEGEAASLISRLQIAKQVIIEAADRLMTIRVMSWLTRAYTYAAQLHLARQEALSALALVEQIGGRTPIEGFLYYSLLIVSYTQNRLEEASDWLKLMLRSAQDWQQVELLVMGELFSARLALARGDLEAAHQALHRLEALIEQEGYATHAPWVITLRVQLWLAEANLAQASEWAAQTTFSPETWDPLHRWEVLMLVRVSLAQQQRGQSEQAVRVATRLAQMTRSEGHARVYLDVGEPIIKQAREVFHPHHAEAPRGSVSPLSLQEQRVLRRLCAGQTYAEMAEALVVSPNTIKTQVSSIYRKLGVSRRAEAIALAARLRLLSSE
jgi:LuxR family maltose regulon positive regulatory protein